MSAGEALMPQPFPTCRANAESPYIWGLDATTLHDRAWAARGVLVVRRGVGTLDLAPAGLFLLLHPHQLVVFDAPGMPIRLPRRRPRVLRIGLTEHPPDSFAETTQTDSSHRLTAIRRRYRSTSPPLLHIALTRNAELASLWHASSDRQSAEGVIRRAVETLPEPDCRHGSCFDARDAEDARRCIHALMMRWRDARDLFHGARRLARDVWVHEKAVIEPGARLVGPVWIGAGVTIKSDDVLIGPAVFPDASPCPAAPPVLNPPRQRFSPVRFAGAIRRKRPLGRRLFNIAFSAAALLVTAPLFPLIMLAIWLEDGRPFLFAHTRQTRGGREFTCYKFRTMCRDAEKLKASLLHENICDGPQFHITGDPRLLRVGRFLRKFHLDELPQFFNVLLGQMDVVGPRPSPDNENQFCPAWRETRLSVEPGMTGLWQVSRTRAPNADFQEWIRFDLDYVRRRNWRLDLWIIYRTLKSIVMGGNQCHGTRFTKVRGDDETLRADHTGRRETETLIDIPGAEDRPAVLGQTGPATEPRHGERRRPAA